MNIVLEKNIDSVIQTIPNDEIKNLWCIKLVDENSVIELRAFKKGSSAITKIFKAKDYSLIAALKLAFEVEALRLNDLGYNIYVVMNPIKADFKGKAATDADIAYRDLLLIDIDKQIPVGEPSTDDEVEAAGQLADDIAAYLKDRGWGDPLRVMSGNGHHLYYILKNIDNTDEAKASIQNILKSLAAKFDNDIVKVDTCVFNASRITKVVGTIARKGACTEERPYRMAKLV